METKEIIIINGATGESKNYTVSRDPRNYTIIKIGNDSRPAGPGDIEDLTKQLSANIHSKDTVLVTHHMIDVQQFKI